jgi:hypothetical protein
LPDGCRDVLHAHCVDRDRRLRAAQTLRADDRDLGESADPLHVVVDPVPIPAFAEEWFGRWPLRTELDEPGLQNPRHLEMPVPLGVFARLIHSTRRLRRLRRPKDRRIPMSSSRS